MDILGIHKRIDKSKQQDQEKQLKETAPKFLRELRRLQIEYKVIINPSLDISQRGIIPSYSLELMSDEMQQKERELLLKEETGIELPK